MRNEEQPHYSDWHNYLITKNKIIKIKFSLKHNKLVVFKNVNIMIERHF